MGRAEAGPVVPVGVLGPETSGKPVKAEEVAAQAAPASPAAEEEREQAPADLAAVLAALEQALA